ncbi:ABC transporter ATP-binding protein [Psychroflexus sp. MES1-P1E]|uniref:ABC transporter ATP-binding protein n=1 Tax=Psychroflexus sp. MES1-P1E TaxID=2058320 RepID=UPI000C7B572E|nr:ABC transporter ATP-binding protein [Psychroflexus sp. MES1-P1E]PKG41589.1 ABC transporter ATP-binding protein [Psychroflexus sp. MES1-P1E]
MLKVNNLSYFHGNGQGASEINFELTKGDHLALIGESGCGKSTLIKAIYGLFDLDEGSIYWKNHRVLGPAHNLVPGFPNFKYLSQEFDLMPFTTSEENIQKYLSRETPQENKKRSDELVALFGLEEVKDQKVKTLSGGQKQRVAIAQALAKPPEVVLLDEPFSNIDQFLKHQLRRRLFQFLKKEKITCIFATHDADDVLPFSDYTMVLKNGKSIDFRQTTEVYSKPKNFYCASLFGDVNLLNSKEFGFESTTPEIIIYPHEINISQKGDFQAEVKSMFFRGSNYLVEMKYKTKSIFAVSETNLEKGSKVNFQFNQKLIYSRLN